MLPATHLDEYIVGRDHGSGQVLDVLVDRVEVDDESNVLGGELVLWLVLAPLLPLQEGWADCLDLYSLLLRDCQHSLVCEFVTDFLHEAFEVVVIVDYPHLVGLGSLAAAPVEFTLIFAEVAVVTSRKIFVKKPAGSPRVLSL